MQIGSPQAESAELQRIFEGNGKTFWALIYE